MKKIILLVTSLFTSCFANAQMTFQKSYGGTVYDESSSVLQTTDGGYIITGNTTSYGAGDLDVYLVKTDGNGNLLWTKTFGGTDFDHGNSVLQTSEGGYVISGVSYGFGPGDANVYLLKTGAGGNLLWSKTFGGTGGDYGNSVQQTTDGGFVIAGVFYSMSVYLTKTDSNGNVLWTKTFGGASTDWSGSVQQTTDGGFVIAGETESFGAGNFDFYLIRTDTSGNPVWTKTYGGANWDEGRCARQTTDGGFVMVGSTDGFGAGGWDVYLLKTDASGNLLWSKTFGGINDDNGYSVEQTTDGGYVIIGKTNSFSTGDEDVYLLKTDATGNLLWSKTFGGVYDDNSESVRQTSDGGYVISGRTNSFGMGLNDVYLIKTDGNGNSGCNQSNPLDSVTSPATITTSPSSSSSVAGTITGNPSTATGSGGAVTVLCLTTDIPSEIQNLQFAITIFPNPATSELRIQNTELKIKEIEIYSSLGKKVFSRQPETSNQQPVTISVADFPAGIYFVRVESAEGIRVAKFVKE